MVSPLNPEIKKDWDDFLEWIYEKKHIMKGAWTPCYMSIQLWLEFGEKEKRDAKDCA